MDRALLSGAQSRPFDVPWRVRDPCYVILGSFLGIVLLQILVGFAMGFYFSQLSGDFPKKIFDSARWKDLLLAVDLLLQVFFLSFFLFRHGEISPGRLFARSQTAWEARYSLKIFFMSVLYTVLLGLAIALLIVGAALLFRQDPHVWMSAYHQQGAREGLSRLSPDMGWFRILLLTVACPPVEEVLFRGGFYGALRKGWSPWKANLASSLLFALLHLYVVGFPYVFLLGILTAYAYERTRSLTAPILVHMLWNGFVTAAARPVVWPVFAIAVLLLVLWGSRARGESPFEPAARKPRIEKMGWKVYAWLFILSMVQGSLSQPHAALYILAEIPIYLAVVGYAYGQAWFPKKGWAAYALFYTAYTAYDFRELSSHISRKATPSHLAVDVVLSTLIVLPSFIALWRLIRGESRVDALSPAVLE